jgi:hypothetical protein
VLMYPDGAGNSRKKQQFAFRVQLVEQLTGEYNGRKMKTRPSTEHAGRYDGFNHWPVRVDIKRKKVCKNVNCSAEVKTECSKCRVILCIDCFEEFHTNQ